MGADAHSFRCIDPSGYRCLGRIARSQMGPVGFWCIFVAAGKCCCVERGLTLRAAANWRRCRQTENRGTLPIFPQPTIHGRHRDSSWLDYSPRLCMYLFWGAFQSSCFWRLHSRRNRGFGKNTDQSTKTMCSLLDVICSAPNHSLRMILTLADHAQAPQPNQAPVC